MIFSRKARLSWDFRAMENETWEAQHLENSTMLHAVEGLVHIPISRSTHLMPSIAIEAEGKKVGSSGQAAAKREESSSIGNSDAKAVCCHE